MLSIFINLLVVNKPLYPKN